MTSSSESAIHAPFSRLPPTPVIVTAHTAMHPPNEASTIAARTLKANTVSGSMGVLPGGAAANLHST